jgi:hypothetical protein
LADRLRAEQYLKFRGESWLGDLLERRASGVKYEAEAVSAD